MTVEELNTLHRRYVTLSQRFRAAWVFHQFLQSLAKQFFDGFDESYPERFQELYAQLKEISQSLNASEAAGLAHRFEAVEQQLGELVGALEGEDSRVEPSHLRRFFLRFRTYDDKVLMQLVRFYVGTHSGDKWDVDRVDKVDYLLSRLAEVEPDEGGPPVLRDRARLREVCDSLRQLLGDRVPSDEEVEEGRRAIDELRRELTSVSTLDELDEAGLVQRYRTLKHGLGETFFATEVLLAVVETNLAFKNAIRELYGREERRIFAEYQQIFDLESRVAVDGELQDELARFRADIERFEQRLQADEMRLAELAQIRKRVRALMPRLTGRPAGGADDTAAVGVAGEDPGDETVFRVNAPGEDFSAAAAEGFGGGEAGLGDAEPEAGADAGEESFAGFGGEGPDAALAAVPSAAAPALGGADAAGDDDLIREHFERLVEALDGTTLGAPPKAVSLTPDVFQFRLEPREVVAYRRLLQRGRLGSQGEGGGDWNEEVERFILRAASLRVRMGEEAEAIRGILDDTVSDTGSPVFRRSRLTVRLGDAYLNRFSHVVHQMMLDGEAEEARELEVLRVRLMQEYAGLWLLSYKQMLTEA